MLGAILLSMVAAQAAAPTPKFEPIACQLAERISNARCGVVRVPEDRSAPGGRSVALNVVVLPARGQARLPPLFDIDGGPGLNGTKNAGFYASNAVSKGRDVVLIDQRGTGRSNPLQCPELSAVPPTEPMLPTPAVKRCLEALGKKADVRFYGTREAVADLEAVRQALGHDRIDLFGLSYGTTVAFRYMQRHPGKVRAAVLMGAAPPAAMPPRQHAPAADSALKLLLADCARDPSCSKRFPRLADDLARARQMVAADGGPRADELFMERVRTRMYSPDGRVALPLAIEKAARGDVSGIFPRGPSPAGPAVADGMFLAVTCTESFGLMDYEAAAREARATPFGDYRLRTQRAACGGWPKGVVDPEHLQLPTEGGTSILLLSGEMDPVTPPGWADSIAAVLPRSRHVVIPGSGHIFDGMTGIDTCLDPLMVAYLDHGDPNRLDTSCIAGMKAPAYVLE